MPTLSGKQAERLSLALRDAFSLDQLTRLLYYSLGQRIDDITLGVSLEARVFDVILAAEREGWILRLISAACDARPDDVALRGLVAEAGLTSAPASLADVTVAGMSLERIILDSPFHDITAWRTRLGALEAQVCRVEIPEGTARGTGFLVAPDLVLTAFHVIQSLASSAGAREARLRFDYKRAANGTEVHPGTAFELAASWLVAARPWSPADMDANPADLPAPDALDFALLRVRDSPGRQRIGLASELPGASERGWIRASQIGSDGFAQNHTLFILQHPEGDPLKLAFGRSDGLNSNKTRLRYQVNTEPGSSGSPCLNASLELVGLHHAGEPAPKPTYNSAVPITAIRDYLAGSAVAEELFAG